MTSGPSTVIYGSTARTRARYRGVAVEAAERALAQKIAPHRLPYEAFEEVPARLKRAIATLIGCPADEVILGNSTSFGLNLLVQGLPLQAGDEVLLIDGDFPASVITWLPLRDKGVEVRLHRPTVWPPSVDEIESALTERTRVFCTSWVYSFFGSAIDIDAIGNVCQERGVLFVLNGAQAVGVRQIEVTSSPVDCLVSCGFKWLCGPYGTGFTWIRPDVLDSLRYDQAYWLAHASARSPAYELRNDLGAGRYDVFGTANFLNFMSWTASVEYLLAKGIAEIQRHDDALIQQAIDGIIDAGYRIVSPTDGPERSTLLLFTHPKTDRNATIHKEMEQQRIHIAQRDQKLRVSPHLYNTPQDIGRMTKLLEAYWS